MALLEQNRLKTRKKCRFRIYLRIYFGCFEVFWLEGKVFLGKSNSVISVRKLDFVILRKSIVRQFSYVLERVVGVIFSADMPRIRKRQDCCNKSLESGDYTFVS